PCIAVHVEDAPWTGFEASDRNGSIRNDVAATGVVPAKPRTEIGEPGVRAERSLVAAKAEAGRRTGPRGIFPFGLGGQPIGLAGRALQPRDIGLCLVPAHAHDRMRARHVETGLAK